MEERKRKIMWRRRGECGGEKEKDKVKEEGRRWRRGRER